jgi:DNA-binding LytR/AlgR family response regulator
MKKNKQTQHEDESAATSQEKKFIRLYHGRLGDIHVLPEKILIAMSGEHKVKVLVLMGKEHEWFYHTGLLDEFLLLLSNKKFERVNKFYILNWQNYQSYNPQTKTFFFTSGFSLKLRHTIKQSVFKKKFS